MKPPRPSLRVPATLATGPVVIEARGVEKTFRIPEHAGRLVQGARRAPVRRAPNTASSQALRDVSFDIHRGEFFGIVGRNGSGKSTLLKILASIYRADAGRIRMAGRLAPFIELGVGFNPELTARENVVLNGVMMGLTRREARRRLDAVIEFAELEEFVDLKLKNYSSGMLVRLAFSVMVQADADVMLIDEVLAVGDAAFPQKCIDVFHQKRAAGKHDRARHPRHGARSSRSATARCCSTTASCATSATPEDTALRYYRLNFADLRHGPASPARRAPSATVDG